MRNRSVLYFTGFLVAIVSFLVFDYSARRDYLRKTSQQRNTAVAEAVVAESENVTGDNIAERAQFTTRFQEFALRMNALSDDPEQSEELLRQFSQTIKTQDIIALNEVLSDSKARQSQRTLALELMVMNQDFASHEMINSFIQNERYTGSENQEFELSLRAEAIEGLTLFADKKLVRKNLENLKIRTRHAFIHDRADKAIQYLSNVNLNPNIENANAEASSP